MKALGAFIGGVLFALAGVFLFVSQGGALLFARETPAVSKKSPAAVAGNAGEGGVPSTETAPAGDAPANSSDSTPPANTFTNGGGAESYKIGNVIILMPARKTPGH